MDTPISKIKQTQFKKKTFLCLKEVVFEAFEIGTFCKTAIKTLFSN